MAGKRCTVLFFLASLTALHSTPSSVEVADSQFGKFDFAELESVVYEPELSSAPVRDHHSPTNTAQTEEPTAQETEQIQTEVEQLTLVSRHGQRYSCAVPVYATDLEGEAARLELPLPNITALLEPLSKQPCLQRTVRWWTYEYCHGQFVRQYHLEAGKISGKTIYLGYFENSTRWDREYVNKVESVIGSMKHNVQQYPIAFHTEHYANGTVCDLTKQSRQTTVRLHCGLDGSHRLLEVLEDETCRYTISVQTSHLCHYPLFDHAPRNPRRKLACSPILGETEFQEYLQGKEELEEQRKETAKAKARLKEDPAVLQATESLSNALYQALSEMSLSHKQGSGLLDSGRDDGTSFSDDREMAADDGNRGSRTGEDSGESGVKMKVFKLESDRDFEDGTKAPPEETEEEIVVDDWESLEAAIADVLSRLADQLQDSTHKPATRFSVPESISRNIEKNIEKISQNLEGIDTTTSPHQHASETRTEDSQVLSDLTNPPSTDTPTDSSEEGFEAPATSPTSDPRNFLEQIDEDTVEELADSLPSEAFDKMLEELDEEALQEVVQEVQDEIQEQLNQAGFQGQADVRVKILPMSLRGLAKEEGDDDGSSKGEKLATTGVSFTDKDTKKTDSTGDAVSPAMSRFINELFDDGSNVLTEDRMKQHKLEKNYKHVWRKQKRKNYIA